MTSSQRTTHAGRRTRSIIVLALALVCAALVTIKAPTFTKAFGDDTSNDTGLSAPIEISSDPPNLEHRASPVSVDGAGAPTPAREHSATALDSDDPAVRNLDPDLRRALTRAATDASDQVTLQVNSGWRSAARQKELLREAVIHYGSAKEAARWVAPPEKSAHVSGDAVDIGPAAAATWLARHGADYGLCRIYRNEPWHFELRPEAVKHGCPTMYADPTEDPRLQNH